MKAKTDVTYYRDSALPGIDICTVRNSDHCFPEHFHDDVYIISLISCGACRCLDQSDLVAGPGGITLINPGQIHSGGPVDTTPLGYTNCYLGVSAMAALSTELKKDGLPEFSISIINDSRATALLANLFRTLTQSCDSLEKEALFVCVLHFLLSRYTDHRPTTQTSHPRHQPVIQARELLAEQLDCKLSLSQVAANVGLSRYHFLRTFKQETGITPHLFRTLKRLEQAKLLLKQGMPPARIALETGFSDQSHFSNTFRRYVGATPGQYLSCT